MKIFMGKRVQEQLAVSNWHLAFNDNAETRRRGERQKGRGSTQIDADQKEESAVSCIRSAFICANLRLLVFFSFSTQSTALHQFAALTVTEAARRVEEHWRFSRFASQ
jgi:hypothetical protein